MKRGGFTLLELLIVIAVVGLLVAAMIPLFRTSKKDAQIAKTKADLDVLVSAHHRVFYDTGVATISPRNFSDVSYPVPGWNGPYVTEACLDPWGNNYQSSTYWSSNGVTTTRTIYFFSRGPNGVYENGTGDDIWILVRNETYPD